MIAFAICTAWIFAGLVTASDAELYNAWEQHEQLISEADISFSNADYAQKKNFYAVSSEHVTDDARINSAIKYSCLAWYLHTSKQRRLKSHGRNDVPDYVTSVLKKTPDDNSYAAFLIKTDDDDESVFCKYFKRREVFHETLASLHELDLVLTHHDKILESVDENGHRYPRFVKTVTGPILKRGDNFIFVEKAPGEMLNKVLMDFMRTDLTIDFDDNSFLDLIEKLAAQLANFHLLTAKNSDYGLTAVGHRNLHMGNILLDFTTERLFIVDNVDMGANLAQPELVSKEMAYLFTWQPAWLRRLLIHHTTLRAATVSSYLERLQQALIALRDGYIKALRQANLDKKTIDELERDINIYLYDSILDDDRSFVWSCFCDGIVRASRDEHEEFKRMSMKSVDENKR